MPRPEGREPGERLVGASRRSPDRSRPFPTVAAIAAMLVIVLAILLAWALPEDIRRVRQELLGEKE